MESDLFDFVLWCLKTKGSEAFSKQKQNYHTILWSKWCLSGYTVQSSLPLPRLGCLRLRCAASITGSKSLNQYQALCCEVLKLILLFVNICFCGASKQFGTKSWWISSSCQRLLSRLLHLMTLNRCARQRGEGFQNISKLLKCCYCVPFMMILMKPLWT